MQVRRSTEMLSGCVGIGLGKLKPTRIELSEVQHKDLLQVYQH